MFQHRHASDCSCCGRQETVVHASALWKVGLVAGYGVLGSMVFGASLLGLGIIGVIPVLMMAGLGLLPFLHDRAGAPPVCSACGKISVASPARKPMAVRMLPAPAPAA